MDAVKDVAVDYHVKILQGVIVGLSGSNNLIFL